MNKYQGLVTLHDHSQNDRSSPPKLYTPSKPNHLKSRLETLRDYSTWNRAKARRLDLEHITDIHKQPLLNVAYTYGFRNSTHEVLNDIVERHISITNQSQSPGAVNSFEKILSQHEINPRQKSKEPISYVKYKHHNNNERQRLSSMVSPKRSPKVNSKRIAHTSAVRVSQIAKNPPKELKDLKKRLKSLPSVSRSERKSVAVVEESPEFQVDVGQQVKEYSEDLRVLSEIFRKQQAKEQKEEMRQAILAQKKDILFRYQYKLNVERDTFRRNVKSYLKCMLDYRNESRRQEVRANGIKRFKRVSMLEKVKRMMEEQAEAQARQAQLSI